MKLIDLKILLMDHIMTKTDSNKLMAERINTVFALVATAKEKVNRGSLDEAMKMLIKALKLYHATTMLKKERELIEEDVFDIELKLSRHPKFEATYGPVSFVKGEHKMAIDFLSQLVGLDPESLEDKLERLQMFVDDEKYKDAAIVSGEIVGAHDVELKTMILVGDIYLKKRMFDEAQNIYLKAGKKFPNSKHVFNRMAISFRKNHKFAEAITFYEKVHRLSPRDEGIFYNIARAYMEWKKPEDAIKALEKALAINPEFEAAVKLKPLLEKQIMV